MDENNLSTVEENIPQSNKLRALKIVNIIFTSLSVIAFIVALVFFAIACDAVALSASDSNQQLGAALGYALSLVYYIIFGVVGAVLAIISAGISLANFKQRKPESAIHFGLCLAITVVIAALLVVLFLLQ